MNTNVKAISVHIRATLALLGLCLTLTQEFFLPSAHASAVPNLNFSDAPIARDTRPALSFAPVIKKVSPSVVNIYTAKTVRENPRMSPLFDDPFFRQFFGPPGYENVPRERREQALGSGVIISEDGYILTNNHVVDGADEVKVVLADDKKQFDAKVIGTDPQTDIAVIKVEGKSLPAITITDSDKLEVGDVVLAGGEAAALVVTEAVTRLLPGALGDESAPARDSFSRGLLEHPQYTRPEVFREWAVPEVLRSGDHARIERWKRVMSVWRTWQRRRDLLETADLSPEEQKWVAGFSQGRSPEDYLE